MKTKITAVVALIIIAGIVVWQVGALNTNKNLASVISSTTPNCTSDAQIKALTKAANDAQKSVNALPVDMKKAKTLLSTAASKVALQDKDVAKKLTAMQDAGREVAALRKKYNSFQQGIATSTAKSNVYKALVSAEKVLTTKGTAYTASVAIRDDLEAKRVIAEDGYARFVIPADKNISFEGELRNQVLSEATNLLASTLMLPKCSTTAGASLQFTKISSTAMTVKNNDIDTSVTANVKLGAFAQGGDISATSSLSAVIGLRNIATGNVIATASVNGVTMSGLRQFAEGTSNTVEFTANFGSTVFATGTSNVRTFVQSITYKPVNGVARTISTGLEGFESNGYASFSR